MNTKRIFAPTLPENLTETNEKNEKEENEETKTIFIGPAVPFGVEETGFIEPKDTEIQIHRNKESNEYFGPIMPTESEMIQAQIEDEEKEKSKIYNPKQAQSEWEMVRYDIEPTKKMERDAWMLELPTKSSSLDFDLMQRNVTHFSRRGISDHDDGSGWTDDPELRKRKEKGFTQKTTLNIAKAMAMRKVMEDRAKQTKELVDQFNEKFRTESLLDIHLEQKSKDEKKNSEKSVNSDESSSEKEKKDKKIKKDKKKKKSKDKKRKRSSQKLKKSEKIKKQKKEIAKEHVPYWDRDRDLVTTRVDTKKRNELIMQAGALNTRFGSSNFL